MPNSELHIARRLYTSPTGPQARPAVRFALAGLIIGTAVMVISVCIVMGFKQQVSSKTAGFGSHIQLVSFDSNSTYELQPIRPSDSLLTVLASMPHMKAVTLFATKPGIIKTDSAFQGVVFKGTDYWDYFAENIEEGSLPSDAQDVLISRATAKAMQLRVGDSFLCYFVQSSLRVRRFHVCGIYNTSMTEMDRLFLLGQTSVIRQLNGWQVNQASGVDMVLDDLRAIDAVADRVFEATVNQLDLDGNALYMQTLRQLNPQIFGWLDLLDMNVWIILILMLAVSSFSIITALIILMMDSVAFIGLMKALGATNGYLRRVFIYRAAMLVGKGMAWGNSIALGVCAVQYVTHILPLDAATYYVSFVPVAFPVGILVGLNGGILVVTLAVLLLPSALIARMTPAKVMTFE